MKWHPDENDSAIFPKLHKYLDNDFCKEVRKKERVWKAFKRYSRLDDSEALRAIDFGKTRPYLFVDDLPGNGRFKRSKPDTIFLDLDVADAFEDHPNRLKRVVESTLLHEVVHWARHNDGNPKTDAGSYKGFEAGKRFECAAYGADIGMDRSTEHEKTSRDIRGGAKYKKFQCPTRRRRSPSFFF